jgi:hypothetical protein
MRQRTSTITGLPMSVAAVTLGVASYLHRQGQIPLGFTVIRGESFYGASVPEAVIGFVLAAAAAVVLLAPRRARPIAVAANSFAIVGVAYGMSVTVASGRMADIIYHCALMALLLATEVHLLGQGRSQAAEDHRPGPQPDAGGGRPGRCRWPGSAG